MKLKIKNRGYVLASIRGKISDAKRRRILFDDQTRAAVLQKTGGLCYICYRRYEPNLPSTNATFNRLEIDHIVPFSKWGPDDISNLMPICERCNKLKSNLDLAEARRLIKKRKRHRVF